MPPVRSQRIELRRRRLRHHGLDNTATVRDGSSKSKSDREKRLRRRRNQLNAKSSNTSKTNVTKMCSTSAIPSGATNATTVPESLSGRLSSKTIRPASNASETSDYQRSTPSPREVQEEPTWQTNSSPREDSDHGYSEPDRSVNVKTCHRPLRSNNSDLKLRNVRISLEKMDMDSSSSLQKRFLISNGEQRHIVVTTSPLVRKSKISDLSVSCSSSSSSASKAKEIAKVRKSPTRKSQLLRETFTDVRKKKLDMFLKTDFSNSLENLSNDLALNIPMKSQKLNNSSAVSSSLNPYSFETPAANPVIRFPAAVRNTNEILTCKWQDCELEFNSTGKLLDHLKLTHSTSQNLNNEEDFSYKCLWKGCKVFGKSSSSRSWLEKHVTNHGGNKPFGCIVDSCKKRFGTQILLHRHVNAHFRNISNNKEGNSDTHDCLVDEPRVASTAAVKIIKKAGKRLKFRKTIFSARIFDVFDVGIMAKVQEKLVDLCISGQSNLGIVKDCGSGLEIDMVGTIVARRTISIAKDDDKKHEEQQVMIRWTPENIVTDEWVPLAKYCRFKKVRLTSLPFSDKQAIVSDVLLKQSESSSVGRWRKNKFPQMSTKSLS